MKRIYLKKIYAVLVLLSLLLTCVFVGLNNVQQKVYADNEDIEQICKTFTDSDNLIDSKNISIHNFKEKLQKIGMNLDKEMPELAQIIPAQFLQREETNKEYHYFGQEYGFIVLHDGDNLHVMILDFDWKSNQNNECRLKVEIIVNARFQIQATENGTTWIYKEYEGDVKYRLTNLKYVNGIFNENELNYGDSGYTKQNDNGVFLQQTRLAFSGVQMTDRDWVTVADFILRTIEGFSKISSICQAVRLPGDIVENVQILKDNTEEVSANQENYIFTELSREQQLQNPIYETFTRTKYVETPSDIYFGLDDFIEFNTLLNDTNQRGRFFQSLQFDIFAFDDWNNIIHLGAVDKVTDYIYKEQVLFETEKRVETESQFFIYTLPIGKDMIEFTPERNGNYNLNLFQQISYDAKVINTVTGEETALAQNDRTYSMYLKKGVRYRLELSGTDQNNTQYTHGTISFAPSMAQFGNNNIQFHNTNEEYMKIHADHACNYTVGTSTDGAKVTVYNDSYETVCSADGTVKFEAQSGKNYYIGISFTSSRSDIVQVELTSERFVRLIDWKETRTLTVINDEISLPEVSERAGYNDGAWWTEENGQGTRITNENFGMLDGLTVTLYGCDIPIVYQITYITNGGSAIAPVPYTIQNGYILSTDTVRSEHVFVGWYENAELTGNPIERISAGSIGNRTYYAKWVKEFYNAALTVISSDIDGKSVSYPSSRQIRYGQNFTLPVLNVSGFAFQGWYLSDGTKITSENGNSLGKYLYESDISVIAKWSRNKYTIAIHSQDGKNVKYWIDGALKDVAGQTTYYGNSSLCPDCQIAEWYRNKNQTMLSMLYREGHIFKYLTADQTTNKKFCWVDDIALIQNGKIDLYPYYAKEQYTVTFSRPDSAYLNVNPNTYQEGIKKTFEYGQTIDYVNVHNDYLIKREYQFTYWTMHDGSRFSFTTMPDITPLSESNSGCALYSNFEKVIYSINFNLGNGKFQGVVSTEYNIYSPRSLPTPVYTNYRFVGWYTNADGTGIKVTTTQGKTGDLTLYAKYERIMCVLEFYPNAGTSGAYGQQVAMGDTFVLPNATKPHYTGVWTRGGVEYGFGTIVTVNESMTFYAKWTLTPYTIVYNNMYDKYLNQTAYTSAPKTYTYGTFINFAEYDARFSIAYPASQARCEFKGFYMDKNFKNAATLSSTTSGTVNVYAKWIRLVSNTSRTNTTITDKGIDKNPTNTLTIGLDVYGSYMVQEQKEMGFNQVVIKIELTYHRIDDGYQHVYLYNGSAQLNHWEYSASNTTTRTEYMEVVMNIDDLNNVGALYIKYDASGAWSDDWYIERMSASVQFVNHKDDARPMKNGTIFY